MIHLFTYIVSTVLTYVLGLISKKNEWNETLPIPIQNIIVGIVVFFLSVGVAKIMQMDINVEDMINQIIVALGGAGTATLAYDTKKRKEE